MLQEVSITILSHNCHNILFMPLYVTVFLVHPVDAQTQVTALEHFIPFRRSPVSSHFFLLSSPPLSSSIAETFLAAVDLPVP